MKTELVSHYRTDNQPILKFLTYWWNFLSEVCGKSFDESANSLEEVDRRMLKSFWARPKYPAAVLEDSVVLRIVETSTAAALESYILGIGININSECVAVCEGTCITLVFLQLLLRALSQTCH